MKIVLATSNKGKVIEIKELLNDFEVIAYSELIEPFEIIEDGKTFQENAIIKAKAVYERLNTPNYIVIADDSGITVPKLNGEPGIFSARYAGADAKDIDNLTALIDKLKGRDIKRTPAFYTACIAIASKSGISTAHGWMHGDVIDQAIGNNGFGYDPMFIPNGYNKTLGELDDIIKNQFSHRSKALYLTKLLLSKLNKS